MSDYLKDAVKVYNNEAGYKSLPKVETPYLQENIPDEAAPAGKMATSCSSHLMKLLFAARMARPDMLTSILLVSRCVSDWKCDHDRELYRLFCYALHFADLELVSTLNASDLATAVLVVYPDADLAGEHVTSKSTSGCWIELASLCRTRTWPLCWTHKKQTFTASSTCEAETVSMSTALKKEAIPLQFFLEICLGRVVKIIVEEDNTQAIAAALKGYSPALRQLPRTQRISVGVLGEMFGPSGDSDSYEIKHCPTAMQKGGMFTKRLDRSAFENAKDLICMRAKL